MYVFMYDVYFVCMYVCMYVCPNDISYALYSLDYLLR